MVLVSIVQLLLGVIPNFIVTFCVQQRTFWNFINFDTHIFVIAFKLKAIKKLDHVNIYNFRRNLLEILLLRSKSNINRVHHFALTIQPYNFVIN